jgi:type I restriction enzyme S subunit
MIGTLDLFKETEFLDNDGTKVPKDWTTEKLGDVIKDAKSGFASGKRDEKGILQLRMNSIQTDGKIHVGGGVKVPIPPNASEYILKKGDVLFDNTNSVDLIGKTAIFKNEFSNAVYSNHLTRLRVDNSRVTPEWITYTLVRKWQQGFFKAMCHRHVHQAGISNSNLLNIKILLPPMLEQCGVIDFLGVVDSAIELTDRVIAKTERLKKGLMQQLLTRGIGHTEYKNTPPGNIPRTWELNSLEDVCTAIVDCPHTTPKFTSKGFLVVRNFNIRDGELVFDPAYFTTEVEWQKRTKRCVPQNDDVLFSREAPIGEASLAPRHTPFSLGQRTMLLRTDKKVLSPLFLVYTFYSPLVRRKLSNLEAGVTAHHVNVADIRRLIIPIPPLAEQEKIVEVILTAAEKLKLEKKEKTKLELLKRGLMGLLLTGKVRIKVD